VQTVFEWSPQQACSLCLISQLQFCVCSAEWLVVWLLLLLLLPLCVCLLSQVHVAPTEATLGHRTHQHVACGLTAQTTKPASVSAGALPKVRPARMPLQCLCAAVQGSACSCER
jgi:hypothetical protein